MLLRKAFSLLPVALLILASGCGGDDAPEIADRGAAWEALGLPGSEEDLDAKLGALGEVPLDPAPAVGKDYFPTFPPDIPFDPAKWKTTVPSRPVAEPSAPKGGRLRLGYPTWPPTLRTEGPSASLSFLSTIQDLVYERLLGYDYVLEDFVPALATHWQMLPDRRTYRFRLDPRARWADGREVTADDVVATLEHMRNPDRKDPSVASYYGELVESAKALDRLTVEVRSRAARWESLLQIGAGTKIYPAAYMRMDGDTYLTDWNWKLPPGTGPYEIREGGLKKGRSLTISRREDWWGKDLPQNLGQYNFDEIEWQIVRDEELEYQKFLAGELDINFVSRAQRWVEEVDREQAVRMGWVQKRKIHNRDPQGNGGFVFNMRKPPFDDRRIRLAFTHLFHREKLMASFFFHQYEYMDSYFPGSKYTRPNATWIHYDPERARALLGEAGWVRRDERGFLVDEKGARFPVLGLEFSSQGWQRIFEVVKKSLWDEAGIMMELKLLDDTSLLKKVWEYKFDIVWWGWTGSNFPSPEFSWHSKNADMAQTNNLNGFKDPEADRIIELYQVEFDAKKRIELLQDLDAILFEAHPYALNWYSNYFRVLYWDRFGHPPEYFARYGLDLDNILALWWFDPALSAALEENRKAGRPNYPDRPGHQSDEVDHRWWLYHELPMEDDR